MTIHNPNALIPVGTAELQAVVHAAVEEMVLAQSLGDADCQAPRDEKGHRGACASAGRDHASHLG